MELLSLLKDVRVTSAILIAVCHIGSVFGQHPNIRVGGPDGRHNPNETCMAISPADPLEMVAAANKDNYYHSTDGGQTWCHQKLTSTFGVFCDPCVIADSHGTFYYFHLPDPSYASGNFQTDRIVCQKLLDPATNVWTDGFSIGVNPTNMNDKEWAGVDWRTDHLYCAWTAFDRYGSDDPQHRTNILFSRSTNGGVSWSAPLQINEHSGDCLDKDDTVEGTVFAFGPEGEVYVGWVSPYGVIFDRSTDGGTTWLEHDIVIADLPGGWDFPISGVMRNAGFPSLVCDLSGGPHHGTLYASWTDQRNGEANPDVWMSRSADGGDTWEARMRVNDDSGEREQFFSWMTLDQITGYLYVVFYDRRNYSDFQTDVYLAVSQDGGESFRNVCISETPFIPREDIFLGDYIHVAAHDDVIRPIWTRIDGEENSVWTALVDPSVFGGSDVSPSMESPRDFLTCSVYPNPFNAATTISFELPHSSNVSLRLYDLSGRTVMSLLDGTHYEGGRHTVVVDCRMLSSGMYVYRLTTSDGTYRMNKLCLSK